MSPRGGDRPGQWKHRSFGARSHHHPFTASFHEVSEMQMALKQDEIKKLQHLLAQKKTVPAYVWILILLAIILGFLIEKVWISQRQ